MIDTPMELTLTLTQSQLKSMFPSFCYIIVVVAVGRKVTGHIDLAMPDRLSGSLDATQLFIGGFVIWVDEQVGSQGCEEQQTRCCEVGHQSFCREFVVVGTVIMRNVSD